MTRAELRALIEDALRPWERRLGSFGAGDATTDVLAVLDEAGLLGEIEW